MFSCKLIELTDAQRYVFWRYGGYVLHGLALEQTALDKREEAHGRTRYEFGLRGWRDSGAELHTPFWTALHSEVQFNNGNLNIAESGLTAAENSATSRTELWWSAEILRLQGKVKEAQASTAPKLHSRELLNAADAKYRQALALARRQSSSGLQVRAALSLGELHVRFERLSSVKNEIERVLALPFDEDNQDLLALRRLV